MKIKELHLRNIASIEAADINFDTDLLDPLTGQPSPIFLIAGDTGVGKTALLDALSLALYKTTPRLASVANPVGNNFRSNEGETIGIGSLAQYTRLGISHRDECYSEVVFEGNDGLPYRARLDLGLKRTGEHRDPRWTVKIGEDDWVRVDAKNSPIQQAIGLSFQQFGRMALLAQGQFASFLCGDKKEREEILEQLTNTERFSAYGAAIKNLYDRAKRNKEMAEATLQTETAHLLPPELVETLRQQQQQAEEEKKALTARVAQAEQTLQQAVQLADTLRRHNEAQRRLAALQATRQSPQHQEALRWLALWDQTEPQRQWLRTRDITADQLKKVQQQMAQCGEQYAQLSATLGQQEATAKAQQAEIERLIAQRTALNPDETNRQLALLAQQERQYALWNDRHAALLRLRQSAAQLGKEVESLAQQEAQLAQQAQAVQQELAKAQEHYDTQARRYNTLRFSLDKQMKLLRHRLAQEQADTCPLCGQHIDHLLIDDEFAQLLTPMEQNLNEAKEQLAAATKAQATAQSALHTVNGKREATHRNLLLQQQEAARTEEQLRRETAAAQIEYGNDFPAHLQQLMAQCASLMQVLRQRQQEAERVGKLLADKQTEKKRIDEALAQAFKQWNDLQAQVSAMHGQAETLTATLRTCVDALQQWQASTGLGEETLRGLVARQSSLETCRRQTAELEAAIKSASDALAEAQTKAALLYAQLFPESAEGQPSEQADGLCTQEEADGLCVQLRADKSLLDTRMQEVAGLLAQATGALAADEGNRHRVAEAQTRLAEVSALADKWSIVNRYFGGTRFRTLVQTHILKPLLHNANLYLEQITDRYRLTCSEENEKLSILVHDRYNKDAVRSATVLSGGERFMVSLALSLALSSLNRPDLNVNILFIDEGFGTLDEKSLDSVMSTLEQLQAIAGQTHRRVGIISHREELQERIHTQIHITQHGEGRSRVEVD